MSHPILTKPHEVFSHLTCAICLNIPMEPALLNPCQHIFCVTCVSEHRKSSPLCPSCRSHNSSVSRLEPGSLIYRVWSEIDVKCGNIDRGCAWSGSIANAKKHMQACKSKEMTSRLQSEVALLKHKCGELERVVARLENEKAQIVAQLIAANHLLTRPSDAASEVVLLKKRIKKMEVERAGKSLVPDLFHGTYNFDRFSVVRLSQLIARYLEDKPNHIDSNKVFDCVRSCYQDLERGYNDNPEHYRDDMRMLLATCVASTWFSGKQQGRFLDWMMNYNWDY